MMLFGLSRVQEETAAVQLGRSDSHKLIEVVGYHVDIDVVIPWYKTAVTNLSQTGASAQGVLYPVLAADAVYLFKTLKHGLLHCSQSLVAACYHQR